MNAVRATSLIFKSKTSTQAPNGTVTTTTASPAAEAPAAGDAEEAAARGGEEVRPTFPYP